MSGSSARIRSYSVTPLEEPRDYFDAGALRMHHRANHPPRYRVNLEVDADEVFVRKLQAFIEDEGRAAQARIPIDERSTVENTPRALLPIGAAIGRHHAMRSHVPHRLGALAMRVLFPTAGDTSTDLLRACEVAGTPLSFKVTDGARVIGRHIETSTPNRDVLRNRFAIDTPASHIVITAFLGDEPLVQFVEHRDVSADDEIVFDWHTHKSEITAR